MDFPAWWLKVGEYYDNSSDRPQEIHPRNPACCYIMLLHTVTSTNHHISPHFGFYPSVFGGLIVKTHYFHDIAWRHSTQKSIHVCLEIRAIPTTWTWRGFPYLTTFWGDLRWGRDKLPNCHQKLTKNLAVGTWDIGWSPMGYKTKTS